MNTYPTSCRQPPCNPGRDDARRPFVVRITGAVLLMACCATSLAGADWPGFRGATGSGVSPDSGLPVKWSATDNLRWVTKLPGRANSSPAVIGDRVYLTTATDDDTLQVLALAASSGEKVWTRSVGSGKLRTFGAEELYAHRHNSATPTPAADEGHVWAFFGTGLLVCLDRDGNVRWEKNLTTEYGEYDVRFGMASSPRLWGENLYLTCLQKGPSYVVALDKRSGKEVWKKERSFPAEDDGPDAYSSPVLLKENGKVALIVAGSDHVNAYDTRSGAQLWFSGGLKVDSAYGRIICSPAVGDGVVVQCSANPPNAPGHAVAWRTGGKGDVSKSHRLWSTTPHTPDAPTPVCYKDSVYMVRDDGIASIHDLRTGVQKWRGRLGPATFRAALVAGDEKVYYLSRDGLCVVMKAGSEGEILARNQLDDTFYAAPAISDGVLYLRGYGNLFAVGQKK